MTRRLLVVLTLACALASFAASARARAVPFPPNCDCNVVVTQNPIRTLCLTTPPSVIVRLCPQTFAPFFDGVTFNMVIRDAFGVPLPGVVLKAYETGGTVNISNGGSTMAVTNAAGAGSISVFAGSGCGTIGVCADGVLICEVRVRSPDVAGGGIPATCPLPTGVNSFVNASDILNAACGYVANFGLVVPANACWDLDCSGAVNAADIIGTLGKGGVLQHFGHGGLLNGLASCP